jgi:hypothetical protein
MLRMFCKEIGAKAVCKSSSTWGSSNTCPNLHPLLCTLYPPAYHSFIVFLMNMRILLSRKTIKVHRTRGALETSWNPLETSAAIFQKPKNQNTKKFEKRKKRKNTSSLRRESIFHANIPTCIWTTCCALMGRFTRFNL